MRKQNVIVFSSSQSIEIVQRLEAVFKESKTVSITNWKKYFAALFSIGYSKEKSYPLFNFLTKRIPSFDFAIIVAGRDDILRDEAVIRNADPAILKERDAFVMRDNVVFELGMCCMALGETRVILLHQSDVRLLADLRGYGEEAQRRGEDHHSTELNINNIQLEAFAFNNADDIQNLANDIEAYIKEKACIYAPVIVGASCATASGYLDNFIRAMSFDLEAYANQNSPAVGSGEPAVKLIIPDGLSSDKFKDLNKIEFRLLLPNEQAWNKDSDVLEKTRMFCSDKIYRNKKYHIFADCTIADTKRSIGFACKYIASESKLVIIDVPTTILSSYKTAKKILSIKDDAIDDNQESRYMTKEIDMFKASLFKLIEEDNGKTPQNGKSVLPRLKDIITICDFSLDEETDRKNLPWLYE